MTSPQGLLRVDSRLKLDFGKGAFRFARSRRQAGFLEADFLNFAWVHIGRWRETVIRLRALVGSRHGPRGANAA